MSSYNVYRDSEVRSRPLSRSSHSSRHALPGVVVSAQLDYAIRGLVSLALATDDRTKIEILATDHGLSRKFLAQVLVSLRDAGIVTTRRGSDGGYGLARGPREIRMIEVFEAVSPAGGATGAANGSAAAARTQEAWAVLAAATRDALGGLTLADLTTEPARGTGRGDRTAGGLALEASDSAGVLPPGAREEVVAPRGA